MSILPNSVDHAVENLTAPLTTNIGTTFGDLWFLVFGGISQAAQKRKIKYAVEAEKFRKDTEERIRDIPEDDLKEPNAQIATQALEQSKYCIEEEALRKMFSELIASSMMKSREGIAHPAFAILLSQMSPADASALKRIQNDEFLPVISVIAFDSTSNLISSVIKHVWMTSDDIATITDHSNCLDDLVRLGLVEIMYDGRLQDNAAYDNLYSAGLQEFAKRSIATSSYPNATITIDKGYVTLTKLGKRFISCVLPQ